MLTALLATLALSQTAPLQEEQVCAIADRGKPIDVLGHYEDISTKNKIPVTRGEVITHLKTIGFNTSMALPLSQIKTLETKTAAFLAIQQYVLQLAKKEPIEQELTDRIKLTKVRLMFDSFLAKQVRSKINAKQLREEALTEIKRKYQGEYGYDVFVVATTSMAKAKAVHEKIQALHNSRHDTQNNTLIQDLEALAKDAQKDIDIKQLNHPAFVAAKQTNGWLVPRHIIQQQTQSNDLVFLIREMLEQLFGKEVSVQMIGNNDDTRLKSSKFLSPIMEFNKHFLVVYIVDAKPFDELPQLAELIVQEEFRKKMMKKQKEIQLSIIKDLCVKNKHAVTLIDAHGKEVPISEQVLNMLSQ